MATDRTGTLHLQGSRLVIIEDGTNVPRRLPAPHRMGGDLSTTPSEQLVGRRVGFEYHKAQVRRVWPEGELKPLPPPPLPAQFDRRGPGPDAQGSVAVDRFRNPYTFVPSPARKRDGELGDRLPASHATLGLDTYTGRIGVVMKTETPLLVLDDASRRRSKEDKDHWVYDVAVDGDGRPAIPPTAVKGMLRSAYEAVTNSRYGVFVDHDGRLGYRMSAPEGLALVPARVSDDGTSVELLPGTTPIGGQGKGPREVLHAAWLPVYDQSKKGSRPPLRAIRYTDGKLPSHRDRVTASVTLVQHSRRNYRQGTSTDDFRYWQVTSIARAGNDDPSELPPPTVPSGVGPGHTIRVAGWVYWSGPNIKQKHDERVFFTCLPRITHPLTRELRQAWRDVIASYRSAHDTNKEIKGRRRKDGNKAEPWEYLGDEPGKTAWSLHLYEEGAEHLRPGDLCYARLDASNRVERLFPVTIGRDLFRLAPSAMLDLSLQPPTKESDLSPADRVFGWAHGSGEGAHRGQLRVGPVRCVGDAGTAVARFDSPLPLAILGQPKPQQGRFYLAEGTAQQPRPMADRTAKRRWFVEGQSLRGRKVYLHHAGLPDDYWTAGANVIGQPTPVGGRHLEYRRPPAGEGQLTADRTSFVTGDGRGKTDSQNRSVTGWVAPQTEFRCTVEVTNLSAIEIGGLLWLLRLPESHFHRMGLGKSLGFGSVRLDIDEGTTDVRSGADWQKAWRSIEPLSAGSARAESPSLPVDQLIDLYKRAVLDSVGSSGRFESVAQVRGFLAACSGDPSTPVHYPRVRPWEMDRRVLVPPDPRGKAFEWFVENERVDKGNVARGVSLPDPWDEAMPVHVQPQRARR